MRVLLIEDTRIYSEQLASMLAETHPVTEVHVVAGLTDTERCLLERPYDVAIVNVGTTGSTQIIRAIGRHPEQVPVVALGVLENEEHVIACAEAGVSGYLPKHGSLSDLLRIMQSVQRGETPCSPKIAATLFRHIATLARQQQPKLPQPRLTPRELEVLTLVAQGWSNKDISKELFIEVRTVKNHVHNILRKMKVHRRGEAAARAREILGLLEPTHTSGSAQRQSQHSGPRDGNGSHIVREQHTTGSYRSPNGAVRGADH
jgi:two-component system, NarL family, nitrate/nitrite response regulator NarL